MTVSYLKDRDLFLRKHTGRLLKLIYPFAIVIMIEKLVGVEPGGAGLYWFNVLILFYIIYGILIRLIPSRLGALISMGLFVTVYAVFIQFIACEVMFCRWIEYFGWPQQSLGFVVGIAIAVRRDLVFDFIKRKGIKLL